MAEQQPSFSAQFQAFLREGAKDLHNNVIPAFPQSGRGVDEPGTPLNPTAQMVTQELQPDKGYSAMLESYAAKPGPAQEKQQEMER